MRLLKQLTLAILASSLLCTYAQGQFLKKLKEKVNSAINKTPGNTSGQESQSDGNNNSSTTGKPTNTKGGGLTNTTPPDVNQQITEATQAHAAGNYSDARYSIQRALMSIELQLGRQILQSLPSTVSGLQKDTMQNKVMSTQWGWSNLTIQTVYKKDDQQMTVNIGNMGIYSGFVNMYFNSAYTQTTSNGNDQDVKQTKVKGYKALIKYDKSQGYTLLVPLGQTSLIAWECVNFATEQDVMNAANAFDIDKIKKMLGEQ
jgi:hypothetical protein